MHIGFAILYLGAETLIFQNGDDSYKAVFNRKMLIYGGYQV